MKTFVTAALIAAHLAAAPAMAASLERLETSAVRAGAFAGARVRVHFGGRDSGRTLAGVGIGPVRTAQASDGRIRTSFGEGVSFGFAGNAAQPRLSLAGRSIEDMRLQADGKGGDVPTWAWVAGGVVLVLGAAFIAYDAVGDASTE